MAFSFTTLLFEILNFVVLVWLLRRIVYRPLRSDIEARKSRLRDEREQTARALFEAQQLQQRLTEQRGELEALRQRTRREAAEQAAQERARLLEQAREDAAAEQKRAQHTLQLEREAALAGARALAVERSTEIAGRLLLQLAPQAVHVALLNQLLSELDARAELLKAEITSDGRAEIELSCASFPHQTELERLRQALSTTLGVMPRLQVREDESLLAGGVIRIGQRVLDASLGSQLEALRERARGSLDLESQVA